MGRKARRKQRVLNWTVVNWTWSQPGWALGLPAPSRLCPPSPFPSLIPSYQYLLIIFHVQGSVLGTQKLLRELHDKVSHL